MQRLVRKSHGYLIGAVVVLCGPALLVQPAPARLVQEGPKLIGTGVAYAQAVQGSSVALSGDGNTAIIGAPGIGNGGGAALVFTRSNAVWQQEQGLVGTDAVGSSPQQGFSVALSLDGNTAIVGGYQDNSNAGAAWVFTRSNGVWTQQGPKLVGTGAVGNAQQGWSVALSGDGNAALVGGYTDNNSAGAAWVFTRSNGVWTQQGAKLVGTGAVGNAQQGWSVALSGDGNTAIVGGWADNSQIGAAWVFTRTNGVWVQQGQKLGGTDRVGNARQGWSVRLSSDGNTALVGGYTDNNSAGAAWVFIRTNGVWGQQGPKLVGTGAVGNAAQGYSVALSGNGSTALVGGYADNNEVGAAWVFTGSNGVWTQQGPKLVGTGAVGNADQGASVALSAEGKTAILGGPKDSYYTGAAWVFFQSAAGTHDFNGDGKSDILWYNPSSGQVVQWLVNGTSVIGGGSPGSVGSPWAIVGQRDFNGDGSADILWRNATTGQVVIWLINGTSVIGGGSPGTAASPWTIAGTGDFNGDGFGDLLWYNTSTGQLVIWLLNGTSVIGGGSPGTLPTNWSVVGTGDFNGDGMTDILSRDTSGNIAIWLMNGVQVLQAAVLGQVATNWSVVGTGDFNGDGFADILWRDTSGDVAVWLMNGLQIAQSAWYGMVLLNWSLAETGDFNGDGFSDFLWYNTTTGQVVVWLVRGTSMIGGGSPGSAPSPWEVQGLNAD
jgi:hypothetical protein